MPDASFELTQVTAAYFRRPGMPEPMPQVRDAEQKLKIGFADGSRTLLARFVRAAG